MALHRAFGEANWTGQVASGVDFENGEAGVLLVVWAQAAIKRAAVFRLGLRCQGSVAGFQPIPLRLPIGKVVADQSFLHPMRGAAFEIID